MKRCDKLTHCQKQEDEQDKVAQMKRCDKLTHYQKREDQQDKVAPIKERGFVIFVR